MLARAVSMKATATGLARTFTSTQAVEARQFFVGGNWKCNGSVQQSKVRLMMMMAFCYCGQRKHEE